MNTTLRFPVKLFLAACVVAVSLGDPSQASAQNYMDAREWTQSQLHIHYNIRKKDLLEVRKKMAEVREDLNTARTSSRHSQTREEYQAELKQRLQKLTRQEQRLLRDMQAIKRAYQHRRTTVTHAPSPKPYTPHLGAPVPPTTRPKYDPDTEHYLGQSRPLSEKETKELIESFRRR